MSDDPDDLDLSAAEYVLGTLEESETEALALRARSDPALAAAIARWQARLAPLAGLAPEAAEPAGLWEELVPQLRPTVPVGERLPLAADRRRPSQDRLVQTRRSLSRWRFAAGVLLVLGLGAGAVGDGWWRQQAGPRAVATLAAPGSTVPLARVEVAGSGLLRVRPLQPIVVPPGRSLAFWAWPLGAPGPTLLGAMPPDGASLAAPALPEGSQVMVTLEGPGGAEPGQAPGTTLFAGVLAAVPGS